MCKSYEQMDQFYIEFPNSILIIQRIYKRHYLQSVKRKGNLKECHNRPQCKWFLVYAWNPCDRNGSEFE